MKVITKNNPIAKQFEIDGISEIQVQFETGDVFINKEHDFIYILNLNPIKMINQHKKEITHIEFLSDQFKNQYRWCGKYGEDMFYDFDSAMRLNDD